MGLFNPPPTPPTNGSAGLPPIQVPSFQSIGQAIIAGANDSDWATWLWHKFWAGFIKGQSIVFTGLGTSIQALASIFVTVFTELQAVNSPGFFALVGAMLEDLLATPVDGQALQNSFRAGGTRGALRSVGSSFYDNLIRILGTTGGPGGIQPSDGPARQFLGFLIEYAIRAANMTALVELLPEELRVGEGFAAYGESLERTLSFGRMARRAFQPLIQHLIADPLTRQINQQYRPKLLAEGAAVKAFFRGDLAQSDLQSILAQTGYSDNYIQAVIDEHRRLATDSELIALLRIGSIDDATATTTLENQGVNPADSAQLWQGLKNNAAHSIVHQFVSEIFKQVQNGFIDNPTAQGILQGLPLLPEELNWYKQLFGQLVEFPRKHLSESEVEKAFIEGLIDMTTAQNFWVSLGYSQSSIQILTLLLLQRQQGSTKTTTGRVGRKLLTEAEIEKAFKAGIINMSQAQAYWTAHGYTPTDIQILTQLLLEAAKQPISPVSGTPT